MGDAGMQRMEVNRSRSTSQRPTINPKIPRRKQLVGQWIETACFLDPKFRTSMKDLHDSYCSWCDSSSLEPLHSSLFGKELTRLGYKTFKAKKGNGRIGIGLKRPPDVMGNVASKPSRSLPPQLLARSSGSSVRASCSLQAAWGVCPGSRNKELRNSARRAV